MNPAKIRLSAKETELVTNTEWILTKNGILQKVNLLLAALQVQQEKIIKTHADLLPAAVTQSSPKISKGENYKGLPYLVLDYPRLFTKEDTCAVRTMFWWGHFFSITLQLSGVYKKQFELKIIAAYELLKQKNFFYSPNQDEWEHHFEEDNYVPLSQVTKEQFALYVTGHSFLKIAANISLQQWDEAEAMLAGHFALLITELIA
jgi:hypothetical protein